MRNSVPVQYITPPRSRTAGLSQGQNQKSGTIEVFYRDGRTPLNRSHYRVGSVWPEACRQELRPGIESSCSNVEHSILINSLQFPFLSFHNYCICFLTKLLVSFHILFFQFFFCVCMKFTELFKNILILFYLLLLFAFHGSLFLGAIAGAFYFLLLVSFWKYCHESL